jgi:hypothetical protein
VPPTFINLADASVKMVRQHVLSSPKQENFHVLKGPDPPD